MQNFYDKTSKQSVAVLLSTYNGEKYLREQIDSILNQGDVNIKLYIRDDGSVDRTRDILSEYCVRYKNICWIESGDTCNIGVLDSYFRLLEYAYSDTDEIDFFAFSDQDDVWLSDKLSVGVRSIEKAGNINGALYYSNKTFVDSKLNILKEENITFYDDFLEVLWPSLASGCTMVFDRNLLRIIVKMHPTIKCLHDAWVYRVAKCIGATIFFDSHSYLLYRQHDKNVCGMATTVLHHNTNYMITHFLKNLVNERNHVIQKFMKEIKTLAKEQIEKNVEERIDYVLRYNKSLTAKLKLLFMSENKKRNLRMRCIWIYKVLFNLI